MATRCLARGQSVCLSFVHRSGEGTTGASFSKVQRSVGGESLLFNFMVLATHLGHHPPSREKLVSEVQVPFPLEPSPCSQCPKSLNSSEELEATCWGGPIAVATTLHSYRPRLCRAPAPEVGYHCLPAGASQVSEHPVPSSRV